MKQEDCFYCGYTVLSGAKVCGHCNAERSTFRDKSFGARIVGAVKGGATVFGCVLIIFLLLDLAPESAAAGAVVFAPIGVVWGLFRGTKNTEWRR